MQIETKFNPLAVILIFIFTGPFGLLIVWLMSFNNYPEPGSHGEFDTGKIK